MQHVAERGSGQERRIHTTNYFFILFYVQAYALFPTEDRAEQRRNKKYRRIESGIRDG